MIKELLLKFDVLVEYLASLGPAAGFFLIVLESIIPVLPLGVFIAMNVEAFGPFAAYIISYFATVVGCILSYYLFRTLLANYFERKIATKEHLLKASNRIKNISFSQLVLILSMPFTPASLVNALAGINKMGALKFSASILVGKVFDIFFWVFVGASFKESFENPKIMIMIISMLLVAYITSKLISKKMNLE